MTRALAPLLTALGVAFTVAASAASCAQAELNSLATEGEGGAGGEAAATTATTTTTTGMMGPCVTAADCMSETDACNVGTCINGSCQKTAANENGPCDDGKQCTTTDHCEAGVCTGPLKTCSATTPCHVGFCDVATDTCIEMPGQDGAGCIDDDACTLTSICQGGQCVGNQGVDCSFLDSVCGVGTCDPTQGCVAAPVNDGTACDDGFYCTDNDVCVGGACQGQPKVCVPPGDVCNAGVCNEAQKKCVVVAGNDGAACDDGNNCTAGETCFAGTCSGGNPTNFGGACNDADGCSTIDTCDNAGNCLGGGLITACIDQDKCCPANCDLVSDSDCVPACCGDDQNPFPPDVSCFQGAAWIAWEYTPSCSFNMTRLELHTDGGSVALLTDAGGLPGNTLFQGGLGAPDANGFLGADVNPPLALVGGQKYWIAEAVGLCSIATAGVPQAYYGSFNGLNGPWNGPFLGYNWTSHVIGECGP